MTYVADTIAAIATPPGAGGIGVIRVSGPAAESIATRIIQDASRRNWASHRLYPVRVIATEGTVLDQALAVIMRGPHSYTGEDVLELHCHGSPAVLRLIVEQVLRLGVRPAEPGEFTKRAYLNGKIDLTRAEAVIDLVRARTPESAAVAADQLFGRLAQHLESLKRQLLHAKAHLEVQIDFVEEDIGLDARSVGDELDAVAQEIDRLLATSARGHLVHHGLRVAIVGRPNAGKSSLLNALLGEDRAIVTPIPGTTRDVIEHGADFDGIPVILCDTAGLREPTNEVERLGIDRARLVAGAADLTLLVIDGAALPAPPIVPLTDGRVLVALNKSDLARTWSDDTVRALLGGHQPTWVSATQHTGLDALRRAVLAGVCELPADNVPPLTRSRHRDALGKARDSLHAARGALRDQVPADLIAVDVQAALDHIGAVTGAVGSDDVLDAIFAEFCIGK